MYKAMHLGGIERNDEHQTRLLANRAFLFDIRVHGLRVAA
jgi:hypothetical protein